MSMTKQMNSKANVKQYSNADFPVQPRQPVIARMTPAESTSGQTVINLPFSVDTNNAQDAFFLAIDGKVLSLGSTNDYTMTSVDVYGFSSQCTLNYALSAGLNIQAWKLGIKKEIEFAQDQRFVDLYTSLGDMFQGYVSQAALMQPTTTTGTPAAGYFYSSILNRSSMVDLRQDLKPRIGIERIPANIPYQIQDEFGPNGEAVMGLMGDKEGKVRLVGHWAVQSNDMVDGYFISTSVASDTTSYIEVTFYGTGLNVLGNRISGTRDARVSINGGSESGGNIFPGSSISTIINGRNYQQNIVLSAYSGLALGVHTVKIRSNAQVTISGFEVLNESASVKTNPGIGYYQGKKVTTSIQDSTLYSSPVTGTRGGRVLVYQDTEGSIGRAFQATNASQANLTSADHTNESVARTYHWREFGVGRTDDFSRNPSSSPGDYFFTLEDGTTTLIGDDVTFPNDSTFKDSLAISSVNGTLTLTFVGTGLDIELLNQTTSLDTHTVTVNGSSIGNLTAIGLAGIYRNTKIVSGLPYGTHTVRIQRTVSAGNAIGVRKFTIYQPKKPIIPAGAIELADYNVMANFAANSTAGTLTMSTGVLRKNPMREFVYVNGTGGTTDWTLATDLNAPGGLELRTDRQNGYFEYTFVGTGFDLRFSIASNRSANISVTLNGLAATVANFPSLVSTTYGTGASFAAGVLDMADAASSNGAGFTLSGLPYGKYTVRFNNNTASSNIINSALDIITPIHKHLDQEQGSFQNTMPIGSVGIKDSRALTPVKNVVKKRKAWAQATGVSLNPTTTSSVMVPMPDMSTTITLDESGELRIIYSAAVFNSLANSVVQTRIYLNGNVLTGSYRSTTTQAAVGNNTQQIGEQYVIPVDAGTHKVDVYWTVSGGGGTATANQDWRVLTVEEK